MATGGESNETQPVGLLAEFKTSGALVAAAQQMRESGYRQMEAFTPFPVHGLDRALGIRPSPLPWLVLGAGLFGAVAAIGGQWWTNAVDYPFLISGKPLFSLPANIPVAFEVIILLSALAAFFGMLALNGLPKLANPLFASRRFARVTTDSFFLLVEASDKQYSATDTAVQLASLGAEIVEQCDTDSHSAQIPRYIIAGVMICGALALIPPLWIARARAMKSDKPRLHGFRDMDFQPRYDTQTAMAQSVDGRPLFADGRAMRPPVEGTVARGELEEDLVLYQGLTAPLPDPPPAPPAPPVGGGDSTEENSTEENSTDENSTDDDSTDTADPAAADGSAPPAAPPLPYATVIPVPITEQLMDRGQQRYVIYCAPCHGLVGEGNGLVSARAVQLEQPTWLRPTSLHVESVRSQPVGQLFRTISNGVRKMPGYSGQISVEDRWAIVLYLRALQRSQAASREDVPAAELETLRLLK